MFENKENGLSFLELYRKVIEVNKCKIKDNSYSGVHASQDLEPEETLKLLLDDAYPQTN